MKTRFQLRREKKGKTFDPLVIEEFDWDNEWADSSHVFPRGSRGCDIDENGLTWQLFDEALDASSSLRGRNLPRNANKRARNSNRGLAEIDSGSGNEGEEEENQDPLDDADVTDCEDYDASNGSNAGGEDMEATTNVVDEFDDGY
ncbi:hypothetical protein C2845_PM11G04490 [Panicum miliaceum]|uniref:Uncharacterized protein n=1 Tax=Panicum miliaceum TaxID=4540 RepID=A0A3L6RRS5_PANMI|nr:hypothetical protein C2845_PM11G04490 [Panicum miliaceum]